MANFNMDNYDKTQSEPSEKIERGDLHGKASVLHDRITFAQNVIAADDEILLPELPAYARVLEVIVESGDLGTTGVFSVGHKASDDASIVEDADAFIATVTCTAAVIAKMSDAAGNAGMMKRFAKPVQPFLKCTTATDAADGVELKISIIYMAD